ncbi:unnamed protein product, partial [Polarella glacialis]
LLARGLDALTAALGSEEAELARLSGEHRQQAQDLEAELARLQTHRDEAESNFVAAARSTKKRLHGAQRALVHWQMDRSSLLRLPWRDIADFLLAGDIVHGLGLSNSVMRSLATDYQSAACLCALASLRFERARKFGRNLEAFRQDYQKKLDSPDFFQRQLGTALFFVDVWGLRGGHEERSRSIYEPINCLSLRLSNIDMGYDCRVQIDLIGKFGHYRKSAAVDATVLNSLLSMRYFFCEEDPQMLMKKPSDDLFDRVQDQHLTAHMKEFQEDLTATVLRTYNASVALQRELDKIRIDPDRGVDAATKLIDKACGLTGWQWGVHADIRRFPGDCPPAPSGDSAR